MDTEPISNDPQGLLERAFIAGSLRSRHYRLKQSSDLTQGPVKQLMAEAVYLCLGQTDGGRSQGAPDS